MDQYSHVVKSDAQASALATPTQLFIYQNLNTLGSMMQLQQQI